VYVLDVQPTTHGEFARFYWRDGTRNSRFSITANASGTILNQTYSSAASEVMFTMAGTEAMRLTGGGYLLIGYTASNGSYPLQVNGQIYATSGTIATSDARYKTNVAPINGALAIVQTLNPVQFNWTEHHRHNFDTANVTVGFLAQEVQEVLKNEPYLNSIVKKNEIKRKDEDGTEVIEEEFYGIAEGNMIAILTKAIQELKAEFDEYKRTHP
jgi:hypothetical protein